MKHRYLNIVVIGIVLITGCNRVEQVPGIEKVTGSIKVADTPVEGALITFQPEGNARAASARTDKNGNFALTTLNPGDGALPGDYKVTVSKVEDNTPEHNISAQDLAAMVAGGKKAPAPPKPSRSKTQSTGIIYHVPKKYMTASDSGLQAKVVKDEKNRFEFNLDAK